LSGTYTLVGITTSVFADKKLPSSTSTIHYTRLYYTAYENEDGEDEQKIQNGRVFLEGPGPRRGVALYREWNGITRTYASKYENSLRQ